MTSASFFKKRKRTKNATELLYFDFEGQKCISQQYQKNKKPLGSAGM